MSQISASMTTAVVYKRLWGYTRQYWPMFALGIVGVSLDAGMQAMFIGFVKPLIDRVFVEKDAAYGLWLAAGVMGVVLLRISGFFAGNYGMEWTGRRVVADLRKELFASYLQLSATFYDHNSPGQLISKLAYNSEQVANAATKAIISAFRDIMLLVYLVGLMLNTNARLTMVLVDPGTGDRHGGNRDQPQVPQNFTQHPEFHGGCRTRDGRSRDRTKGGQGFPGPGNRKKAL